MAKELKPRQSKAITPRRPLMNLTCSESDLERLTDDFFDRRARGVNVAVEKGPTASVGQN